MFGVCMRKSALSRDWWESKQHGFQWQTGTIPRGACSRSLAQGNGEHAQSSGCTLKEGPIFVSPLSRQALPPQVVLYKVPQHFI